MSRLKARTAERLHERWLYATGALLWVSGLGWLVSRYLPGAHGDFGQIPQPSVWWMRVHGGVMLVFLIVFGAMIPAHMLPAWRLRINRPSGVLMLVVVGILVLTGYGLYYAGDEDTRPWISAVHWIVGLGAAAALVAHRILGRHRRKASIQASGATNVSGGEASRSR